MRLPFRSLVVFSLLLAGSLHAQTFTWAGGASGDLDLDLVWAPFPPTFNGTGSYVVDGPIATNLYTNGPAGGALQLGDLHLTDGASLFLDYQTYLLLGDGNGNGQFELVGNSTGPRATLTLNPGAQLISQSTTGTSTISNADVLLDGVEAFGAFSNLSVSGLRLGGVGDTTFTVHYAILNTDPDDSGAQLFGGSSGTTRLIMGSPLGQAPTPTLAVSGRNQWIGVDGGTNQIIFNSTNTDEAPASFVSTISGNIDVIQQAGTTDFHLVDARPLNPITVNGGHLIYSVENPINTDFEGSIVVNGGTVSLVNGFISQIVINPGGVVDTDPPAFGYPDTGTGTAVRGLILSGELQLRNPIVCAAIGVIGTGPGKISYIPGLPSNILQLYPQLAPGFVYNDPNAAFSMEVEDVTGSPAADLTIDVPLSFGGYGLRKTGLGTLVLNGGLSHYGALQSSGHFIDAGTLVSNSHFADAIGPLGLYDPSYALTIQIAAGATLAGDDHVDLPTFVHAGGHLAPGTPFGLNTGRPQDLLTGTLMFNHGLTLEGGSFLDFDLGTVSDSIGVTGTLTGPDTGLITLNLSDAGGLTPGTLYTLLSFTTSSGLEFSDFTLGNVVPGYEFDLQLNGTSLQVIANVPEPSTGTLLACAALLGLATWRPCRHVAWQGGRQPICQFAPAS